MTLFSWWRCNAGMACTPFHPNSRPLVAPLNLLGLSIGASVITTYGFSRLVVDSPSSSQGLGGVQKSPGWPSKVAGAMRNPVSIQAVATSSGSVRGQAESCLENVCLNADLQLERTDGRFMDRTKDTSHARLSHGLWRCTSLCTDLHVASSVMHSGRDQVLRQV